MSFLVDDSDKYPEVQWSTPLAKLVRDDFVLEDEYMTSHATIEDALSHRTGMPRHDLSYGGSYDGHKVTPKDVVRSLRYLPLTAEPRTAWQYCNLMYVTVSYIIETLTGSWLGDVIRTRILAPLDMKSTYFSMADARKGPEGVAQGYYYYNGSYIEVPDMDLLQVSGAGFIVSNVLDYSKWIRAMIDKAPPISKAGHQAIRKPRMLGPPIVGDSPYTGFVSYALGWDTGVYRGHQWWQHGGGMEAFGADVVFFPDLRFGLVAFGNIGRWSNYAEKSLIWHLIDEKLGVPEEERFDWNKESVPLLHSRTLRAHTLLTAVRLTCIMEQLLIILPEHKKKSPDKPPCTRQQNLFSFPDFRTLLSPSAYPYHHTLERITTLATTT